MFEASTVLRTTIVQPDVLIRTLRTFAQAVQGFEHEQILHKFFQTGVIIEKDPENVEVNGQSSAELGGHVSSSTLSVHQMAHAGVVPHPSSSELSAHQMPARDDLWKG